MNLDQFQQADIEGTAALVILGSQILGRTIPDHWGGLLGFVRRVAKVIGMYNGYGGKSNDSNSGVALPSQVDPAVDWQCPNDCPHRIGEP